MTVNLDGASVSVYLTSPDGDISLGKFDVKNGAIDGTDQRGVSYRGTCTPVADGVNVELTATVPAGTRMSEGVAAEGDTQRKLSFFLNADQVAGRSTKPILLTGFGRADVRFQVQ
jgi:hypothetical protein